MHIPNNPTQPTQDVKKKMPKINFSIQNVCSLNISKPCRKTYSKLASAVKTESDIIFLSDARLNSNVQIAALNDIKIKLRFLGYSIYHNSSKNSRGVAILISNKLLFSVVDTFMDNDCNIIMLKIMIAKTNLTIGSIFGPNNDDENFFNKVSSTIDEFGSDFTIIGGDWNTTYDTRSNRNNIDVLNTVSIPSARRSQWLNHLCNRKGLIDPFRHFYPDVQEFTYVPFAVNANNRSRLDFFVMSERLVDQCVNCRIPHYVNSSLFDHKQVTLSFRRENPYKRQTVNDVILTDPDLLEIVEITTIECYINHLSPNELVSDIDIEHYRTNIGGVCLLQKELVTLRMADAENGFCQDRIDRANIIRNAIKNSLDLLPNLEVLQTYNLTCGRDAFLEILIMSIKGIVSRD
jgi:exonuclease III